MNIMRKLIRAASSVLVLCVALSSVCGHAQEQIRNPFYNNPIWRLWFENDEPINYTVPKGPRGEEARQIERGTLKPTPMEERLYPDFEQPVQGQAGLPVLRMFEEPPDVAGFWDDCYVTMDFGHSGIRNVYIGPDGNLSLRGQYMEIRKGSGGNVLSRCAIGANFTSQSYSHRGRHIVDDTQLNDDAERNFFFVNCIRATPAHRSYDDNDPEAVHDDYDGLYGHSYQSVGQSSSEVHALTKMLVAGGCMSREMKNRLKKHGLYAVALLTIFKAALPYTDANGQPVAWQNELRHRPAYSSHGRVEHRHFCRENVHYHSYDDAAHMRRMIDLARRMEVAPPIALLKVVDLTVEKDGQEIVSAASNDPRIKCNNRTILRVWGAPGETLKLRVDVRDSYDLGDNKLTYEWHPVYPNQGNLSVEEQEPGVFALTCKPDERLPKGRMPVMLVVRNEGELPSNPCFVNFYRPEPMELDNQLHFNTRALPEEARKKLEQFKVYPVTRNRRPVLDLGLDGDTLWCRPGEKVDLPLNASDPEGYSLTVYRWPGEVGEISAGHFRWRVPEEQAGMVPLHLIFSDGTGGYTGRLFKLVASARNNELPDGWRATLIGNPPQAGQVVMRDGEFVMAGSGSGLHYRDEGYMFACRSAGDEADLECNVAGLSLEGEGGGEPRFGLMVREHTDTGARHLYVAAVGDGGTAGGTAEAGSRTSPWGGARVAPQPVDGDAAVLRANHLRIVRVAGKVAGFVSEDGKLWQQVLSEGTKLEGEPLVGLALCGGGAESEARVRGRLVENDSVGLPVALVTSKARGKLEPPVTVEFFAPEGVDVSYSLDGADATTYTEQVEVTEKGKHVLRARLVRDGTPGPEVVTVFTVE